MGQANKKRRGYQKKPNKQLDMAKEHMGSLFESAKDVYKQDEALAQRYVTLARKVAMKFKISVPSEYKRLYCKHCYKFLVPGKTLRVRVHEGRVIHYCLHCKKFWRKPIKTRAPKTKK
ncbi:TPA: ribonuclease P [Candidatus Woesearchaeota archaeon]|nr:ribonuclease P [Candidatus Woesearchaeota archaeon]